MTTSPNKVIDCNKCTHTRECPIPRHVRKDGVDACEEFNERTTRAVFKGIECADANEALEVAAAVDANAITIDGKYIVVSTHEVEKIERSGKHFAYVCDNGKGDGGFVTVLIN